MQERFRDDGFEASFVVSTSRADAWKYLTEAKPVVGGLPDPRPGQWWIPAIEGPADELEVSPEELLRVRKATFPCAGTEIVITMEDAETGTRITVVQSGFDRFDGFEQQRPWLAAGWYPILADFVVFFERGIALGRHVLAWGSVGCSLAETDSGLRVVEVDRDGFAARAGMAAGDLIVRLAGAPVLTIRDLSVLTRGPLARPGDVRVRYLRGDQVIQATAPI